MSDILEDIRRGIELVRVANRRRVIACPPGVAGAHEDRLLR